MITLRSSTTKIVVHCSATRKGKDDHVDAKAIDKMHTNFNRNSESATLKRIGYHEVIKRDGAIELGRYHEEMGAGVRHHNHTTYHICLIGGYDENGKVANDYTDAQWSSLEITIRRLKLVYPDAEICGHRDFPNVNKACPCFDAREWWEGVSKEVLKPIPRVHDFDVPHYMSLGQPFKYRY